MDIDDEVFDNRYGLRAHPIAPRKGGEVAARVVSRFEEKVPKTTTLTSYRKISSGGKARN